MKILLTGQLVIAAVQILCIFENSGKAGKVNGGKEKKYKKEPLPFRETVLLSKRLEVD